MFQLPQRLVRTLALPMATAWMGCASSTLIHSDPPGAALFVNGSRKGYTPYLYEDSRPAFTQVQLRLEAEGYEPFEIRLTRDEVVEVANVLGAVLCIFPAFWVMGYEPEHVYVLKPSRELPAEDWLEDVRPESSESEAVDPELPGPAAPPPARQEPDWDEDALDEEFPEPGT